MTQHRKIFLIFFIFLIGLIATACILIFKPTVTQEYGMQYTVRQGASIQSVENDLLSRGIIQYPFIFRFLVRFYHDQHHLKAGEYLFPKGSSAPSILKQMMTGTGLVQHSFTIIAGWNFQQVRNALDNEVLLQHDTSRLTDAQIMQQLGFAGTMPEGEFFPDTYFYTSGNSDITLLKRAYKKMQTALNAAWLTRDTNLPYQTSYDALIAASLIEKEAHVSDERPIIAGVLINRLHKNMRLQFDPTVIYAMGKQYTGTIYKKDLTLDSPYNTYVHTGLPPTPIAMPSLASIDAVLHPDVNDYLYFVAKGDGRHEFTKDLTAHHEAVSNAKITVSQQPFFNSKLVKQYIAPGNSP